MSRFRTMRFLATVTIVLLAAIGGSRALANPSPLRDRRAQVEPYIYVSGSIRLPGRYDWTDGMSVLDAIKMAGGFIDAAASKVRVLHRDGTVEHYSPKSTDPPPLLRAGDHIGVARRLA
jgi:protein involved in polysaccharide export with SLBB domain